MTPEEKEALLYRLLAGSILLFSAAAAPIAQSAVVHAAPSAAVTVVHVKAFEYKFKLSKTSIPAPGTVKFVVKNTGKLLHDFKIDGKKTPLLQPGQTKTLTVTFSKPGSYSYLCTVEGHAALGMKGVFTVK